MIIKKKLEVGDVIRIGVILDILKYYELANGRHVIIATTTEDEFAYITVYKYENYGFIQSTSISSPILIGKELTENEFYKRLGINWSNVDED